MARPGLSGLGKPACPDCRYLTGVAPNRTCSPIPPRGSVEPCTGLGVSLPYLPPQIPARGCPVSSAEQEGPCSPSPTICLAAAAVAWSETLACSL